jgi:hypothetical protein
VPPLNEVVVESSALCPESIVVGTTEITGAESVTATRTVTAFDTTGAPVLSVTRSSKLQVPTVDRGPVEVLGVLVVVQPALKDEPRSV